MATERPISTLESTPATSIIYEPWPLGMGGHFYGAPESIHTVNYMELAFINMAYSFSTDTFLPFLIQGDLLNLTREILNVFTAMTKYTCGLNVLPPAYINSAKNLFLWYMMRQQLGESYIDADKERHSHETTYQEKPRPSKRKRKRNEAHPDPFFTNGYLETVYTNNMNYSAADKNESEWDEIKLKLNQCLESIAGVEEKEFILRTSCGHVRVYTNIFTRYLAFYLDFLIFLKFVIR